MKKKSIRITLSIIALAFVLTGCSVSTELIDLSTTFKQEMSNGFFSAVITFPLAQAINWLQAKTGNIFLAITLVTLALNVIVLAFTFKSSVAMQKMQEIQPEIQKIQAKYEGRNDQTSQQRMAMEMQQVYNKYGINPLGSLAATFIQFPLLIGMYNAVRRSSAVANGEFLGTTLAQTPGEAFTNKVWVCMIIFILMVVFQFISIKTPSWLANYHGKKEADSHHKTYKAPAQQNAGMTYGMLVMIAFAMLSCPTALSLYYCIYSVINILKALTIDALTHKGE